MAALLALGACLLESALFVSSLYFLVPPHIRRLPRDNSLHIQSRARALVVAVAACVVLTYLMETERYSLQRILLGKVTWSSTLIPLVSYFALFSGPVTQLLLLPDTCDLTVGLGLWIDLRNIVVAPLSEEIVFRGCLAVLTMPYFSPAFVTYVVPMFFGVAHVHHAVQRVLRQETDTVTATKIALYQTAYTTIFGALMMNVLLTTRNIIAVILIHSWCNFMGMPNFGALLDDQNDILARLVTGLFYVIGITVMVLGLVPSVAYDLFGTTAIYEEKLYI